MAESDLKDNKCNKDTKGIDSGLKELGTPEPCLHAIFFITLVVCNHSIFFFLHVTDCLTTVFTCKTKI